MTESGSVSFNSITSNNAYLTDLVVHSISGQSPIEINDDLILDNKTIMGVSTLESVNVKISSLIENKLVTLSRIL